MITLLLLALAAVDPVDAEAAKRHFDDAQLQYKLGRFEAAFEDYRRAYELVPHADLLFNMGQCQRNLKNLDLAIFFFRGYLRDTEREEDRARVLPLIDELEAELAASKQVKTSTPSVTASPVMPPDPPPEDEGVLGAWWFWAAVGVLAAGAAAGAVVVVGAGRADPRQGTIGTVVIE